MKIAIYSDWWNPDLVGGAEQSAYAMALALQSKHGTYKIKIFTYSKSFIPSKRLDGDFSVQTVFNLAARRKYNVSKMIKVFEKIRIIFDPISPRFLVHAILNSEPDVLIIHNMDRVGTRLVKILSSKQVPMIRIFHDLGDSCINRKRFKRNSPCKQTCFTCKPKNFQHRKLSMLYTASIAVSSFTKTKLKILRYCEGEILVGYPEIQQQIDKTPPRGKSDLYSIGFVGRLVPEKGVETLIEACRIVREKFDLDVQLVIAGAGSDEYLSKIRKLTEDLHFSVLFTGYLENPFNYLRKNIDLIVVPSLWEEPLGRIPLEAGCYGIPSLVSEIGGLVEARELLSEGVSFFKPGNPEELAQKIYLSSRNHSKYTIKLKPYRTMASALSELIEKHLVSPEIISSD